MVVIVVVPKQGFITVTPGKCFGANVHVGVMFALVDRRLMGLVLPMIGPLNPRVGTSQDQGRNDDAVELLSVA